MGSLRVFFFLNLESWSKNCILYQSIDLDLNFETVDLLNPFFKSKFSNFQSTHALRIVSQNNSIWVFKPRVIKIMPFLTWGPLLFQLIQDEWASSTFEDFLFHFWNLKKLGKTHENLHTILLLLFSFLPLRQSKEKGKIHFAIKNNTQFNTIDGFFLLGD